MMDTVSVEGELISSEEYNDPGWMAAHERRNKTKKTTGTDERVTNKGDATASKMRKPKAPRTPQLPEEDYKVVIRPRGGTGHGVSQRCVHKGRRAACGPYFIC
ncbi:hypothetical protein MTO96_036648 [Rhipicephalus appendiculatus]